MADKTTVVEANDKGQFTVPMPQSSIDRVDVIDLDLVVHGKNGERLILPGAALEAMTPHPPVIRFNDGAVGADGLLSAVGKVETPSTSIPAMTSLTQFDQKRTAGKKNRTADGAGDNDAAQQAQAQQVAPLPESRESTVDKLLAKASAMEEQMRQGIFTPEPPKVYHPSTSSPPQPNPAPKTAKVPLYVSLYEGNYIAAHTEDDGSGNLTVLGAGGPSGTELASGILPGDARQYATTSMKGGGGKDIFYADAFHNGTGWSVLNGSPAVLNDGVAYGALNQETGLAPSGTAFYYAKEVQLNIAGYIRRIDSITISGLPAGVSIQGATDNHDGTWSLNSSDVVPSPRTLVLVYDTTAMRQRFNHDSNGDGIADYADVEMAVNLVGVGITDLNVTKKFLLRFQDVTSTNDITTSEPQRIVGVGGGWSDVYFMETAGAPELIVTFDGTYDGTKTLRQNVALHAGATDDDNTVYAGNSNDTILAGGGKDTIYAYAGDDAIAAGDGDNTVWAGDGNDTVYSGTGNDVIHLGRGNNVVEDTGGNNTIDIITTRTIGTTTVSANGKDVVTITGDGNNTITVGDVTDAYTDGDDTVSTRNGTDIINVGDGNNLVQSANGDKTVTSGGGNDTIALGTAAGTTLTSGTYVRDFGGSNHITTGDGNGRDVISITGSTGTDTNTIHTGIANDGNADGNDTVITGLGTETIEVGDGNNIVTAGNGDKTVTSGTGNDIITLGTAAGTALGSGTYVRDYGGSNAITTGNGDGRDVISISAGTGSDTNTIWTGLENDGTRDGDDTVITGNSVDVIHVGDGNNIVTTGNSNKTIWAGTGNDTITTGTGNDLIYVGGGNNTITDGGGSNTVSVMVSGTVPSNNGKDVVTINGDGNNTIIVGDEADAYTDGNDTVTTQNGIDVIKVGDGDNWVHTGNGDKSVTAGSGNDTVTTGSGDDIVSVGNGNNTVSAGDGNNQITTGSGNDIITLGTGANTVTDGGGSNTITTSASGGKDVVSITAGTGSDTNSIYVGREDNVNDDGDDTVITGNSVDIIHLGDGDNWASTGNGKKIIYAGSGNDTITTTGGDGNDTISAGDGTNRIWAGSGNNDITTGSGDDSVTTGNGTDVIRVGSGDNIVTAGNGDKTVTSGGGDDTITLGTAIGITLTSGTYVRDTGGSNHITTGDGDGRDVISITGSAGTDINTIHTGTADDGNADGNDTVFTGQGTETIEVGDGDNIVTTGDGDKSVVAGSGNDTITTGTGDDDIRLGGGANIVTDGGGSNFISASAGSGKDVISLTAGAGTDTNTIWTGVEADGTSDGDDTVITGDSVDIIHVGDGDNYVWAINGTVTNGTGTSSNSIYAGSGDDTLVGGNGTDLISAGGGSDWIYGGGGNNSLDGGTNSDGSPESDWLSFNGVDRSAMNLVGWLRYAGTEVIDVSFTANASGSGNATHNTTLTDTVANVENIIGTRGDDTLDMFNYATASHTLYGLAGDDLLKGSALDDTLCGGLGNDSLWGYAGDDVIYAAMTSDETTVVANVGTDGVGGSLTYRVTGITAAGVPTDFSGLSNVVNGGAGADTMTGSDGNDYFIGASGEYGDATAYDTFIGGAGLDTVDHSSYGSALVIDLVNGFGRINGGAYIGKYSSIECVLAGSGNDNITGTAADEVFYGGAGGDNITAGGGDDTLYGGDGNDVLISSGGSTSTIYFNGGSGSNEYRLRDSIDTVVSTAGNDRIFFDWSGSSRVGSLNVGVYVNLDNTTDWNTNSSGGLTSSGAHPYFYNGSTWNGTAWVANMVVDTKDTTNSSGHGYYNYAEGDTYTAVEHIYGTYYSDVLIGNSSNNVFFPAAGNDAIYGLGGADILSMMWGGTRNDGTDFFDGGNDGAGADVYTLSADGNGKLSWAGGDLIDFSSGNNIDRQLSINLDSGNHNDSVATSTATGNAGMVSGWTANVFLTNVEHATGGNLGDFIYGSAANNVLSGGGGADTIYGNGGDDFIYGGIGGDYIDGGTGNNWASYYGLTVGADVYLADADLDNNGFNDKAAGGWASYQARAAGEYDTLINIQNIEGTAYADRLAGDGAVNSIFGGAGDDTIYGAGGNDVLDGGSGNDIINGGTGTDTMSGGSGNDTYYVDSATDVIVDTSGTDTVYASASYTLASNVEILIANNAAGLALTGNTGANTITGGAGNDTLDGLGGADIMMGGGGNDTYVVDNTGDVVSETSSNGTDTINTTVSYTLGNNVENLVSTNTTTGLTLTGNALANIIIGNSGNDSIVGNGGADSLIGNGGADTFVVTAANMSSVALIDGGAGSDTLTASGFDMNNAFSNAMFNSIETINVKNSAGGNHVSALDATKISNILDTGTGTLTLRLDNGDYFALAGSTAAGGGNSTGGTEDRWTVAHTSNYTYGSYTLQVQWSP